MRKLFFIVLLMLVLPALLFSTLENGAGYVLIAVGDTTVEMAFLMAVVLNLLAFAALYFLIAALRSLLSTRRGVLGWAKNQRKQRGLNRTTQGLIAFVEGRWDYARKSLDKAADNASTPLVNYLFAARASSAMGDAKAVDAYLKQAELSTEGADVAIGLTQAELQIHNGQYEQALATLLRAKKIANHHPVVLSLLAKVYRQLNDWDSLLKLLPNMRKFHALPAPELSDFERDVCCAKLVRAADEKQRESLMACWKQLPGDMRKDLAVIECYANCLLSIDAHDEAERVLRYHLQRQYQSRLIKLYGLTAAQASDKQLAFANKLLKLHGEDPGLLLALARIEISHGKTTEAKQHLQQSVELGGVEGVFAELGAIAASEGDYRKSSEYYSKALEAQAASASLAAALPLAVESDAANAGADQQDANALFASADSIPSISVR